MVLFLFYQVAHSYGTSLSLPTRDDPFETSNEPRQGVLDKNVLPAWPLWISAALGGSQQSNLEAEPSEHPRYTHGCRCAILGCSGGDSHPFWPFSWSLFSPVMVGRWFSLTPQWLLCAHLIGTNKTRPINKWVHFFPALQMLQQLCRWALGSCWLPCSKALQVFPTICGGSFGRASCPLLKKGPGTAGCLPLL